nr:MAG TPA: hypothetical protein [Caudoviricetes sp.]
MISWVSKKDCRSTGLTISLISSLESRSPTG